MVKELLESYTEDYDSFINMDNLGNVIVNLKPITFLINLVNL